VEPVWLVDPYRDWSLREGIPIYEGLTADPMAVDTRPWARTGVNGALIHMDARGDFVNAYVLDMPPASETLQLRHLYEEVTYVLDGRGSTEFVLPSGERRSFEWGRGALFSIPLNVPYRHFNGSGHAAARLVSVTDLPLMVNLFRNEDFIFANDSNFPERLGTRGYFGGEGTFIPVREHRNMWETNFVPSLLTFSRMTESPSRGTGSLNIMFILAEGTMHAHMSEIAPGSYKKAHRHPPEFHIFQLAGSGYSLYWRDGDSDFRRVDWTYGLMHVPDDQMWHQHFNTGPEGARYLAIALGNQRYPFTTEKRLLAMQDPRDTITDAQIEYDQEDPRIARMFADDLARNGVLARPDFAPLAKLR
jgi:mannose-6-phosphate isomerase-like protein (cupin superfamily)